MDPVSQGLAGAYAEHIAELRRIYGEVLEDFGLEAIVISSGVQKRRTDFDDQYWPCRPTPHFQHWLPLAQAGSALVLTAGQRPRLLWSRPPDFWEAPAQPEVDLWKSAFEITELSRADALAALVPTRGTAYIGENPAEAASWGLAAAHNPPALVRALDRLRVHKTRYEIMCLAEANRRAALGHKAVREAFLTGDLSELELHLLYLRTTSQDDPETPYKNIVARDEHAATLHHVSYGKSTPPQRRFHSLLLDAGAAYLGYCSDITRTFVRGDGAATSVFGALIQRTEVMQQQLCAAARVGLPYEQLHDRCHELLGQILHDVGIVKMSADEATTSGATRAFLPHGLGHSLGLQCHDVGCAELKPRADNPFLRNTTTIAAGQVFTIEPGVYFIEPLLKPLRGGPHGGRIDWALCEELRKLGGIRIEDDVHVLPEGPVENLTRAVLP